MNIKALDEDGQGPAEILRPAGRNPLAGSIFIRRFLAV
jgi:hypothetical protein